MKMLLNYNKILSGEIFQNLLHFKIFLKYFSFSFKMILSADIILLQDQSIQLESLVYVYLHHRAKWGLRTHLINQFLHYPSTVVSLLPVNSLDQLLQQFHDICYQIFVKMS